MKNKHLHNKNLFYSTLLALLFVEAGVTKTMAQPTGAINGLFTVNSNGDQVCFSQGNLQYIGSASTPYWKFADNQWDYLGDNGQFSTAQDVDRDLFCYGTSSYNHGAVCYQPWSTSTNNSDYWAYGNSTFELFDLTGKADWGYNPISNGGNEAGMWRTMTISEWDYVLNIRSTLSGIRFARAKVNNVCGVILLPDDWEASIYELNNYNSGNYNDNIITVEDWINIFEVNGAVLLPVTGLRTGVDSHEGRADYWSSSVVDEDWARGIIIDYGDFNLNGWHYRHDGKSVRLVRPAQANTSYSIEAVPNPVGGGTISGAGTYDYFAQVTLTATANEGYYFVNWTEGGEVISTESTYSFMVSRDRALEANFTEATNADNIVFADPAVKAICIEHWDTNGDGELSYAEAAAVTALNDAFHGHRINSFNEFQYFTGVTSIEDLAFDYNSSLSSIIIPNSVTSIGYSFRNCENLNSFYLPVSVTSIHHEAFESCRNMEQIVVSENNPVYDSREGCNAIIETASNTMIIGCNNTTIPNTVTTVEGSTFVGKDITSLHIPSSVISFGGFIWCPIEQIVVEEGNSVYDSRNNCNAIIETSTNILVKGCKNTVIPNTVTTIGESAFIDCEELTSITIPVSVTSIGLWAFRISGLTTMTVEATTPPELTYVDPWHSTFGGVSLDIPIYIPCGTLEAYQNAEVWSRFTNFIEMCNGDAPIGAINGRFTVNGNGEQVFFSQGNLQYKASTDTWRFAENQWDFVGEGNINASSSYDGWIDLYCYGTSGYNHGSACYQPWSTSTNNGDYQVYGNGTYSLPDQSGKADWGYNPISNGGNMEALWRTMTFGEWDYMLNARSTLSGIRYVKANVNGFNGWILLPDNWDASWFSLNNANDMGVSFESNIISETEWNTALESNGAVFLPFAGYRYGQSEYDPDRSDYWSSTSDANGETACCFSTIAGGMTSGHWRGEAKAVRLVRPAQANTSYSIEAVPNPTGGGTITGAGTYDYYAQVSLTANANEGYTFYQWKENGNVVSTENPYSFVALFDRSLEAVFLESSTYPLLYSYNEGEHTATVIGRWDGVDLTGELVIPGTVMHNGETYSVTAIGDWAFNGCSGLTSVIFSNSLVSIGFAAFEGCSGLTSVVFPNTLVSISDRAFMGCSLTEVVIPESVDLIGGNPFQMCSNIEQITVEFGNAYYDSRENCNAIIETSSNVLITGCQNTIIPNTVTSIGGSAFMDCAGLTSIVIPASVSSIGFWAFRATGLTMMTVEATTPPELSYVDPWHSTFGGVSHDIPIYIPCGTLEAYQNAEVWSRFTNFIEMCNGGAPTGAINAIPNPAEGGAVSGAGAYPEGAECTLTATASAGYYFVNWTEGGEVVSTDAVYTFIVSGDRDLVANFMMQGAVTSHWTPITGTQYNMTLSGVIVIDGVEQTVTALEVGAFCGDECRGSMLPEFFPPTGQYVVSLTVVSNEVSGETITFRLYDHEAQQELNIQCINNIIFESNAMIGTVGDWFSFAFSHEVEISAVTEPEDAGMVTGTGSYMPGTIVSLTATANAGYVFDSWTVNGETVSTENPYTFTVTGSVTLTARFILQQTNTLPQGWNWYSTYIEMNGNNGLQQLEESLGHNGLMIKTQTPYVQNYYPSLGYDYWFGPLTNVGLTNETSYLLSVSASCEATMTGALASASDHPMTILPGWNWIGYPMTVQQGLSTALAGFTPSANDLIKGQTSSATYYANYGWFPTSFTLVPGQGYMYYSGAEGNKTLTYVSPRDIYVLEPEAECAWSHDAHSYAHNLTLLAVVSIDGEEQRTCNLELGAFVGGECRGSAVLSYFEPTGRWYAMLTVSGDDGETLELAALDKCSGEIVTKGASPMTFTSDAIVGTLDRPYEARFTSAGRLQLYPNPTNRGMAFSIDLPEGETATEIVLFNTLGEPVLRETLSVKRADIRSPKVPGVYMVKVVSKSGNVYNGRLVVR